VSKTFYYQSYFPAKNDHLTTEIVCDGSKSEVMGLGTVEDGLADMAKSVCG